MHEYIFFSHNINSVKIVKGKYLTVVEKLFGGDMEALTPGATGTVTKLHAGVARKAAISAGEAII